MHQPVWFFFYGLLRAIMDGYEFGLTENDVLTSSTDIPVRYPMAVHLPSRTRMNKNPRQRALESWEWPVIHEIVHREADYLRAAPVQNMTWRREESEQAPPDSPKIKLERRPPGQPPMDKKAESVFALASPTQVRHLEHLHHLNEHQIHPCRRGSWE